MRKEKQTKKSKTNEKLGEYIRESEKIVEQKEEEVNIEIPQQAEFFKTPVRFGNIPVDKLPLGCDEKEQYRKIYPKEIKVKIPITIDGAHVTNKNKQRIFGRSK